MCYNIWLHPLFFLLDINSFTEIKKNWTSLLSDLKYLVNLKHLRQQKFWNFPQLWNFNYDFPAVFANRVINPIEQNLAITTQDTEIPEGW